MENLKLYSRFGFIVMMVLLTVAAAVPAATGPANQDIAGDWQAKMDFNGRQMEVILSFARDTGGKLSGKWITGWGVNELKDVKYQGNTLSFVQTNRFRETESVSNFTGTVKDGRLSGTLSGERGQSAVEGTRATPMPAAVGNWQIKTTRGQREMTATLTVTADKDGKLTGQWQGGRSQSEITDLAFKNDKLTFTRKSTYNDQQRESSYELTVKAGTLSGAVKTSRGEAAVEGKLAAAALIGKWDLTITAERGQRKQVLQVNPDLSGMYGAAAIDKVNLEGGQVSFSVPMGFGERSFTLEFKGNLADGKLTGELTGFRDTVRKVEGTKLAAAG
ncbi:MAG TPA: hypothetical protein VMW23_09965 [Sedimentisphaerales bacterium]|nr:hypothetical protein [Sedimentisphaerales bacterium]